MTAHYLIRCDNDQGPDVDDAFAGKHSGCVMELGSDDGGAKADEVAKQIECPCGGNMRVWARATSHAEMAENLEEARRRCTVLAHHADSHRAGEIAAEARLAEVERERDALVEQLGEAREDERRICVEHDERLSEVAMLRSLLADTAKALGKDGALIVAVPSIAREVVEQLGEAERLYRTTREGANQYTAQALHLQRLLIRIVKYAHEDGAVTPRSTRLARALAEAEQTLAGAAQPVVEPRDETSQFHAVDLAVQQGLDKIGYVIRRLERGIVGNAAAVLRQAGALIEAGYAPHPSGTEGPHEDRAKNLRAALEQERRCHVVAGRDISAACVGKVLAADDALLAASPPDGTAPERAPGIVLNERQRGMLADVIAQIDASLAEDPANYGDLADLRSLGDALRNATRPPDGIPGDTDAQKVARVDALLQRYTEYGVAHALVGDLRRALTGNPNATSADGMPGEPPMPVPFSEPIASIIAVLRDAGIECIDPVDGVRRLAESDAMADRVLEERDERERVIDAVKDRLGIKHEWSNLYGYDEFIEEVEGVLQRLRAGHGDATRPPDGTERPARKLTHTLVRTLAKTLTGATYEYMKHVFVEEPPVAAPPTVPGEPHPAYGPCDAFGRNGECSECESSGLGVEQAPLPTEPGEYLALTYDDVEPRMVEVRRSEHGTLVWTSRTGNDAVLDHNKITWVKRKDPT